MQINTEDNRSSEIRVIIKGAGGHGMVVADILWQMHRHQAGIRPVGFIDDDPSLKKSTLMDLDILGEAFAEVEDLCDAVIVGIGQNRIRKQAFERLKREGALFALASHPRAVVAGSAKIGPGSMICAGAIVNPLARIGANVILNTGCSIDHHNVIGDHVHIAPGVHLGGEVRIGEGALVGIGATVLPGCSIGSWSIIGGGAIVTGDVPEGVVCVGGPPRILREQTCL